MRQAKGPAKANELPTLLIVAYTFPPRHGVGGLRPARLASVLSRRGWRVVVLTPRVDEPEDTTLSIEDLATPGVKVCRTDYSDRAEVFRRWLPRLQPEAIRRVVPDQPVTAPPNRGPTWLAARALLLFPDPQIGWMGHAVTAGRELIAREKVSVILTTSPPETCHMIGARLKRETGLPWVADFRDPWSFSHLRRPSLLDRLHSWAEVLSLKRADAIVTVTEGWGRRFRELYPGVRCEVIPNGYDALASGSEPPDTGMFRIVYTGKLDLEQQDPVPLFEALRKWLDAAPGVRRDVEVVFHCYGDNAGQVRSLLEATAIPQLRWGGPLNHRESLLVQASAAVLLVFGWKSDSDQVAAKVFDYLAARRPILVVAPAQSEVSRIVRAAGMGQAASSVNEMATVLAGWYSAWKRTGGQPRPWSEAVAVHSFERRGEDYDALLRALAGRSVS